MGERCVKKDISIQIVRICAMFSIILCHLVQELENNNIVALAQFFNVGVQIFLFISGYLYGNKEIKDKKQWLKSRIKKIIFPMYLFMLILFTIQYICGIFELKFVPIYIFNLQYFLGSTNGAGHLWFLTIILLCYFITPILIKFRDNLKNKYALLIMCILTAATVSSFINRKLGMSLFYILAYILGFIYSNIEEKLKFNIITVLLITLVSIVVRLSSKILFDGSILYDCIIVSITQTLIAFGIFFIIRFIIRKFQIGSNRIIDYWDNISFYIYLTHYMFMVGPVRTMSISNNYCINIFVTLLLSFICANVLQQINELIKKLVKL